MNCSRHQPSPPWWGEKRGCYECAKEAYGAYKPSVVPAWERAMLQGDPGPDALYAYRESTTREGGKAGTTIWLHPNQVSRRK